NSSSKRWRCCSVLMSVHCNTSRNPWRSRVGCRAKMRWSQSSSRIPTGMPASWSSSRKVARCLKFSTHVPEIVFVFDEHGEPEQLPQMVEIELRYRGATGAEHGEPHQ